MDPLIYVAIAVALGGIAGVVLVSALRADSRRNSLRKGTEAFPRHGAYDVDGWGGN